MGTTIGQAYGDADFKVDGPDADAEDSNTIEGDVSDAEMERRQAEVEASEARAKADAADRAAAEYAQHEATMETSDPDNPQDANGNVVHEPPPASGVDGQATVQAAGAGDDEPFDPSTGTVADVNEAVANTDDEAEKQRILAAEKADKDRAGVANANADVEPYDPGAHTAPEVREYLGKVDAKEQKRVLAAEKKGKARSGVLSFTA